MWDKRNPWVADYISVPVAPALTPATPIIALGSTLCLNTPIVTDSGDKGKWRSDDTIFTVDVKSGVVKASAIGHAVLTYFVSDEIVTYTEVNVVPVEQIEMKAAVRHISTQPESSSLLVQVIFTAAAALRGHNCSILAEDRLHRYKNPIIPFRCDLQLTNKQAGVKVQDIFDVQPVYDDVAGEHGCWIQSLSTLQTRQHVSNLESNVELVVTLPHMEGQQEVQSDTLTLDLVPAFFVYNTELHLTTLSPLGSIRVTTLPKVLETIQVTASDTMLLDILTPETDPQSGAVLYPVRLRDSLTLWEREQLDLTVELVSAKTGQKHSVPVHIKLLGQKPDIPRLSQYRPDVGWGYLLRSTLHNYQSWFVLLVIILATGAAVLVGYHAVLGPKYRTTTSSNVFLNHTTPSLVTTPHTFLSPSPSGSPRGSGSPTSPQRLWSVNYNQQDNASSPYRRSPYSSYT